MAYNSIRGSVGGVVDGAGSITKTALAGGVVVLAGPEVVEGIGDIVKDFGSTETGQAIVNWVNGTVGESAQEPAFLKSWQQTFITFIKETAWPWVQALPTTLSETIQSWTTASAADAAAVSTAPASPVDYTSPHSNSVLRDASLIVGGDGADIMIGQGEATTEAPEITTDDVRTGPGTGSTQAVANYIENIAASSDTPDAPSTLETITKGVGEAMDATGEFITNTADLAQNNPITATAVAGGAATGAAYLKGRSDGHKKAERKAAGRFTEAEIERQQAALANMDPQLG